jgi:hypothetical protein
MPALPFVTKITAFGRVSLASLLVRGDSRDCLHINALSLFVHNIDFWLLKCSGFSVICMIFALDDDVTSKAALATHPRSKPVYTSWSKYQIKKKKTPNRTIASNCPLSCSGDIPSPSLSSVPRVVVARSRVFASTMKGFCFPTKFPDEFSIAVDSLAAGASAFWTYNKM